MSRFRREHEHVLFKTKHIYHQILKVMQIGFQLFTFEPMFVFFKIFVRIQLIFRMEYARKISFSESNKLSIPIPSSYVTKSIFKCIYQIENEVRKSDSSLSVSFPFVPFLSELGNLGDIEVIEIFYTTYNSSQYNRGNLFNLSNTGYVYICICVLE